MNEYWLCPACKSFVRASAPTCYRCRAPRPADAQTLASGESKAVLTPGVDDQLQDVAFMVARGRRPASTLPLAVTTVVLTLAVMVVATAQLVFSAVIAYRFASGGEEVIVDPQVLRTDESLATIRLVMYAAATAVWLAYLGLAVWNAPKLGAGTPRTSPLGAILWWFVPFLQAVRPPRIVADLWDRLASRGDSGSAIIGIWWTLVVLSIVFVPAALLFALVAGIAAGVGTALGAGAFLGEPSLADATFAVAGIDALGRVFFIAAGAAFIPIVIGLERRQRTRRAWLAAGRTRLAASLPAQDGG